MIGINLVSPRALRSSALAIDIETIVGQHYGQAKEHDGKVPRDF